ncbi:hypothetical protein [Nocardia transvalensis]|uniref:hypothetical protein n=1 Tax=Nocardia transvalensis TaxID=37333 RepID=UPI0018944745|nr:hypothetical protein [Nocardia transvalensis]MBF6333601.1 hypothetical protein [Nocardia transvalensis]
MPELWIPTVDNDWLRSDRIVEIGTQVIASAAPSRSRKPHDVQVVVTLAGPIGDWHWNDKTCTAWFQPTKRVVAQFKTEAAAATVASKLARAILIYSQLYGGVVTITPEGDIDVHSPEDALSTPQQSATGAGK